MDDIFLLILTLQFHWCPNEVEQDKVCLSSSVCHTHWAHFQKWAQLNVTHDSGFSKLISGYHLPQMRRAPHYWKTHRAVYMWKGKKKKKIKINFIKKLLLSHYCIFHFLGSGPNRGQSPVKLTFVHPYVCLYAPLPLNSPRASRAGLRPCQSGRPQRQPISLRASHLNI